MPGGVAVRSRWILGTITLALAGGTAFGRSEVGARFATSCLDTVNGMASKVAHLNAPFGSGTVVEPKNGVLGIVPEFSLTERSGRTVGKADLLGSYWVASFLFTRCATTCPRTMAALSRLQGELHEDIRLVSVSVDPEHDSPEVLSAFAEAAGADPGRWLFLTGDREFVYRWIREGFLLAVEQQSGAPTGWEVIHSPRLALVDPKGRIRGYYESDDEADLVRLRTDVHRLHGRDLAGG
jgi:protein SCO1/2